MLQTFNLFCEKEKKKYFSNTEFNLILIESYFIEFDWNYLKRKKRRIIFLYIWKRKKIHVPLIILKYLKLIKKKRKKWEIIIISHFSCISDLLRSSVGEQFIIRRMRARDDSPSPTPSGRVNLEPRARNKLQIWSFLLPIR